MPNLSVCIPTYDRATSIEKTIQSVIEQTYDDFEVIVCDNNSNDDTEKIIKSIQDMRVKYFKFNKHSDMYTNHNRCIIKSSGKYIYFLHAGDYFIDKRALEKGVKILNDKKTVALVVMNGKKEALLPKQKAFNLFYRGLIKAPPPFCMFRKSFFDKYGYFDLMKGKTTKGYYNDWEMLLRLSSKYDVYLLSDNFVHKEKNKGYRCITDLFLSGYNVISHVSSSECYRKPSFLIYRERKNKMCSILLINAIKKFLKRDIKNAVKILKLIKNNDYFSMFLITFLPTLFYKILVKK